MKIFLFFKFILILFVSHTFAQWVIQNPGLNKHFTSVFFTSTNIGYLTGDGIILKTTNGGNNWFQIYSSNKILYCLNYVNENTGYATGDEGTILKTTNAGASWDILNSSTTKVLFTVVFLNHLTGYCAGQSYNILKTTDSGFSWNLQFSGSGNLYSVFFTDIFTGWASGFDVLPSASIVFKTTNGGANWLLQPTGYTGVHTALYFFNSNTGFLASSSVCGTGEVIKTTDGGNSWNKLMECLYATFNAITFVNPNTGYVVGYDGTILKTINGGNNWFTQNSGTGNILTSVYFLDSNTGYIAGNNVLLKTVNGGAIGIKQQENDLPQKFELYQNYPNPFNPSTKIKFDIPKLTNVKITIYNLLGEEIEEIVNKRLNPASYEVDWNADKFPSGIYFCKIEAERVIKVRKLVLLR